MGKKSSQNKYIYLHVDRVIKNVFELKSVRGVNKMQTRVLFQVQVNGLYCMNRLKYYTPTMTWIRSKNVKCQHSDAL